MDVLEGNTVLLEGNTWVGPFLPGALGMVTLPAITKSALNSPYRGLIPLLVERRCDAVQAVQANAEMDRILTLLAVQERLGLAEEGPLPPRALADAAIQARPKPVVICRWSARASVLCVSSMC